VNLPTVLDSDDFAAMWAYDAFPNRLLCIGKDGKIAFDAGKTLSTSWDLEAVARFLDSWLGGSSKDQAS
jgi:hypothetical protein